MAEITAALVKDLRDRTGAGFMDCKKALQEVDGDEEAAIEQLRKAGKQTMGKRADRETSTGRVAIYTDMDAGIGTMIELLCESAPVASNEEFVALAEDLAKQTATNLILQRGGGQIHLVGADAEAAHRHQPIGGRQHLCGQLRAGADTEHVHICQGCSQIVALQRMLLFDHIFVAISIQCLYRAGVHPLEEEDLDAILVE